ncbi:MAG TPA: type II toxin-antitoxin system VapC family toxin [Casimicrobiaceae bacterium]|nr:type II toxin-antitoxin system VapC family toxin [Casimicrobiaceae bacterium]
MMLDTNALSAFVDGDESLGALLREQPRACLPVIVLGEFRYGIAQSPHRAAYEEWLRAHVPQFEVLPVTGDTAVAYASLRAALKRNGTPIPANDAWIGAIALQHGLAIVSRDAHFDLVPGLRRRSW